MPELEFQVESAQAALYAAAPLLNFRLRVTDVTARQDNATAQPEIASVILQCQVRIEAPRRRYATVQQERLRELFGDQAPCALLWAHAGALVPGFQDSCMVELPVPCSYDFNVGAVKFFHALEDGEVPLLFLFSGTIFYRDDNAGLQISRIGWSKEARFALPVAVWQQMIDHYYPNSAWLRLERGLFERLYRYKRQHGMASWEQALAGLLDAAGEHVQ